MDTTLGPVEFVFWALFFTFAFGFFLGYVPHIAVCIMTFSESEKIPKYGDGVVGFQRDNRYGFGCCYPDKRRLEIFARI